MQFGCVHSNWHFFIWQSLKEKVQTYKWKTNPLTQVREFFLCFPISLSLWVSFPLHPSNLPPFKGVNLPLSWNHQPLPLCSANRHTPIHSHYLMYPSKISKTKTSPIPLFSFHPLASLNLIIPLPSSRFRRTSSPVYGKVELPSPWITRYHYPHLHLALLSILKVKYSTFRKFVSPNSRRGKA